MTFSHKKEVIIISSNNLTLKQYLEENGVLIVGDRIKGNKRYTEDSISDQINLINDIHKIMTKYSNDQVTKIQCNIGKSIESFMVLSKRFAYELEKNKDNFNIVDEYIFEHKDEIFNSINRIKVRLDDIDYLGIFKRAMTGNEICLGKVDQSNIRFAKQMEIGELNKVSYNSIEEDMVEYIRRVRRKNSNIDFTDSIKKYVKLSNLDDTSEEYIKILLSMPYEFLKTWYKYNYKKKSNTLDKDLESMKKALIYEKEIL